MMSSNLQTSVTYLLVLACLYETATAQSRLCGRALADTLDLVCSGRGFHLGKRSVRSTRHLEGTSEELPNSDFQTAHGLLAVNQEAEEKRPRDFLSVLGHQSGSSKAFGSKREGDSPADSEHQTPLEDDAKGSHISNSGKYASRWRRSGGSIVDECCFQACTFATLESYCAAADEPVVELSMAELRRRLGLSRAGQATAGRQTQRPRPSAEIIRNRERGRGGPFFYLSFGNQATRSPLVE